ncbi:MAG: DUF2269 domain-containing protein [Chloroflexi bacterium]|nr:DUF2269 domain-containing protein [Chloroflexota bacterium]
MTMTPGIRKFALTAHITFSGGWIGAAIAYIGLVLAAPTGQDAQMVRAAFLAMELRYVLVPLAFASLLSGLVMSLGTKWGLFRHYWVLISFLLTTFATVVLLTQLEHVGFPTGAVAGTHGAESRSVLWGQLLHPVGGLLVLLVILVLNVYKPRGMTPYGWRKQHERARVSRP